VAYIGTLPAQSTLCLADNSLTTFLNAVDGSLTDLAKGSRIDAAELANINSLCNPPLLDLPDLGLQKQICNNKIVSEYYYTSSVVKQLLQSTCVLQDRLNLIYTPVFNPSKPQVKGKLTEDFMNFELPDSYVDKFRCLFCEESCNEVNITTVGSLLDVLVYKVLALQKEMAGLVPNYDNKRCLTC
jgi:hypothetical protein